MQKNREQILTSINTYTEQQLTRLQKLQDKTMRSILQLNRFTPTTFMLDALNVRKRLKYFRLQRAVTRAMQKPLYYKGLNIFEEWRKYQCF